MEETMTIKWVSDHYSSSHSILLVGDGDFSFSLSLASSFGSGSNIVATSLDSLEALLEKYSKAHSNLEKLKELEAIILHGVDATKMKLHTDLKMRKFDRIVFNFPHAGFKGKEDEVHLINLHRSLVLGFFKNSRQMLRPYGEIHVSHKTGEPYNKWNLEELAMKSSLFLTGLVRFDIKDYPGYNNKRGDGKNCDEPFHLGECHIFKFRSHLGNLLKPFRVQQPPLVEFHTSVPSPPYVEFHNFVPPPNVFCTSHNFNVHGTAPRVFSHVNNFLPNLGFRDLINERHERSMSEMVLGYIEELRNKRQRQSYEREMHQRMLYWPPTQLYANL
ncbi:hypothetical protein LUZ60_003276 [Juncus effusus]|nr:hypothetical protein LUZ60_003276 [Juncus effusus]